MKNKYSPLEIKEFSKLVALPYTGQECQNYWKGSELVDFFNNLGFDDDYEFVNGKGILTKDLPEKVSRSIYTIERLKQLNNEYRLSEAINLYAHSIENPKKAIDDIITIFKSNKRLQQELINALKEVANKVDSRRTEKCAKKIDATFQSDEMARITPEPLSLLIGTKAEHVSSQAKIEKDVKPEEKKSPFTNYKTQFDGIIEGHPIVFISYAWEDDVTHSKWVRKLADDLRTKKGINVLLDQYNPKGVNLVEFMNDALRCADRVLIIGTPKYKEKAEKIKESGAHYEDQIINQEIYQNKGVGKFVPCLRKGSFDNSFTPYVATNNGYDFSNEENYTVNLNDLAKEIWCKSDNIAPAICENPNL